MDSETKKRIKTSLQGMHKAKRMKDLEASLNAAPVTRIEFMKLTDRVIALENRLNGK